MLLVQILECALILVNGILQDVLFKENFVSFVMSQHMMVMLQLEFKLMDYQTFALFKVIKWSLKS